MVVFAHERPFFTVIPCDRRRKPLCVQRWPRLRPSLGAAAALKPLERSLAGAPVQGAPRWDREAHWPMIAKVRPAGSCSTPCQSTGWSRSASRSPKTPEPHGALRGPFHFLRENARDDHQRPVVHRLQRRSASALRPPHPERGAHDTELSRYSDLQPKEAALTFGEDHDLERVDRGWFG